MTSEFYIALSLIEGPKYRHWGAGDTPIEALENMGLPEHYRKRRRMPVRIERFFSHKLSFAPMDREPYSNEADAWVGKDGEINFIRCQREEDFDEGRFSLLVSTYKEDA